MGQFRTVQRHNFLILHVIYVIFSKYVTLDLPVVKWKCLVHSLLEPVYTLPKN